MQSKQPKILIMDIETSPIIGYTWGMWEQNVIDIKQDWHMLCFVAKWYGEKKTISCSLPDFKAFKKDPTDDLGVVTKLWELFDEADVVVAHNGDQFDIKKARARFVINGLTPPSSFLQIDTKKVAKRYFNFTSNKLDELGRYLGLGRKQSTGGFQLWLDCMAGVKTAWVKMLKYNKQDVLLLEDVYTKLKPWMTNHPNLNVYTGKANACPTCTSTNVQKRGFSITRVGRKQRFQCQDCGAWGVGKPERVKSIEIR